MDAAVLDWNVSWVFKIENSPRDKPFSCVIKKENKATEHFGAFPLFSLLIISTKVHFPEQSCKVNDDLLLSSERITNYLPCST